jgi:hypothetical protein
MLIFYRTLILCIIKEQQVSDEYNIQLQILCLILCTY